MQKKYKKRNRVLLQGDIRSLKQSNSKDQLLVN
jgi:hypothetical protein